MRIAVNPTRMELLRLRRRLAIANRGHKLLKDKQDEMIRRFLLMVEEAANLRRETEGLLADVYRRTLMARSRISEAELEANLLMPVRSVTLLCRRGTIMNVSVPQCQVADMGDPYAYSPLSIPADLDEAIAVMRLALPLIINLGEVEKSIMLMADEIERTRRRVNALEHILIPGLQEAAARISMKLNELERENITRLMKIKEIVR